MSTRKTPRALASRDAPLLALLPSEVVCTNFMPLSDSCLFTWVETNIWKKIWKTITKRGRRSKKMAYLAGWLSSHQKTNAQEIDSDFWAVNPNQLSGRSGQTQATRVDLCCVRLDDFTIRRSQLGDLTTWRPEVWTKTPMVSGLSQPQKKVVFELFTPRSDNSRIWWAIQQKDPQGKSYSLGIYSSDSLMRGTKRPENSDLMVASEQGDGKLEVSWSSLSLLLPTANVSAVADTEEVESFRKRSLRFYSQSTRIKNQDRSGVGKCPN